MKCVDEERKKLDYHEGRMKQNRNKEGVVSKGRTESEMKTSCVDGSTADLMTITPVCDVAQNTLPSICRGNSHEHETSHQLMLHHDFVPCLTALSTTGFETKRIIPAVHQ
ncbi:hypothetical protein J6590_099318 [Homalodisca vitripennis]|nr:hypothetical protein J6590_099318 [Homalodisca vitripennis]